MAYDWGRILAKAINGIFFHVAPNKQLKREESSTIRSMKKRGWSTLLWFLHSNTLQVFCYWSLFSQCYQTCQMLILTISLNWQQLKEKVSKPTCLFFNFLDKATQNEWQWYYNSLDKMGHKSQEKNWNKTFLQLVTSTENVLVNNKVL